MKQIDLKNAFPPVDEGFERGTNRAFEAIRKEKVMRHKMKYTLIAAALVILALAGTAVAAGFNVIEFFAKEDERLEKLAPDSVVETGNPANVESEALGASSIWFDSAYFDGDTLIVGYVMENTEHAEAFIPTEEQLAAMEKIESPILPLAQDEAEAALIEALEEAMEKGKPCGLTAYSVYPSDHILTDDGVDVEPGSGNETVTADGRCLMLLEMETPLPEAIRGRDSLELHMTIWRQIARYYFDGEAFYTGIEREKAGEAVTTVTKNSADARELTGAGLYDGMPVTATAHVSKFRTVLTIDADSELFSEDPNIWYDFIVLDEQGRELEVDSIHASARRLSASLYGNGETPEKLSVYILALTEEEWEEWDEEKLKASVEPIILTPTE